MLSRLSITKRVLVWHVVAVPALVLAIVMSAYQLIAEDIERAADRGLFQRAQAIEAMILPEGIPENEGIPLAILEDHENLATLLTAIIRNRDLPAVVPFVRITASDGSEIIRQGVLPVAADAKMKALIPPNAPPPVWSFVQSIRINPYTTVRAHTEPIRSGDGETMLYLQLADAVNVTTGRLLLMMLLASGLGSVVIIAVSTLIISTGLRPLRRIIRHIDNVEASGLSSRIPDAPRPPELDVLAKDLNHMWERLENAFKVRTAFVAGVSHDLRTPLTILQGQADLLSLSSTLTDNDRARLDRIQRELRHLVRMTNNVLLYTQLDSESARHEFIPVDLGELVGEIVEDMRSYSAGHFIEVDGMSPGQTVMGDYDLLKAAITNIVENATKFTRPSGHIAVSLDDFGDTLSLSIIDDGIGIKAEDLPHVTEPYYRADNRYMSRGGTGLGLTLVDQIVNFHNGRLSIESQPGKGTNVTIELSKAPEQERRQRSGVTGAVGASPAAGSRAPAGVAEPT